MKYTFYILILLLTSTYTSCISDDFSIGDNLVEIKSRTVLVDTCSIQLYTGISDSTVTSGLERLFIGRYTSADFGTITANAYMMFNTPSYNSSDFGSEATVSIRFDSITLILKYDDYHCGDTTQTQTLNLYKLKSIIELDDKSKLYNTSFIASEDTPWVTRSYTRPTKTSSNDTILEIRLPNEFGEELIQLMQTQSDTLNESANFQRYFKGLKISSGNSDNVLINSFTVSSAYPVIRLYYHALGVSSQEKTLDLNVDESTAFTQIENDRSQTFLAPLNYKNNEISSLDTQNMLYLQGLTGLSVKMRFPYINDILQVADFVKVSAAYLYVYPVLGTYSAFNPLPSSLLLNYLDESGKAMDIYVDGTSTTLQSGVLVEDKIYNKNTYYAFDVSSYLSTELGAIGINKTSLRLQLTEDDQAKTFKSLVFRDSQKEDNKVKLLIYYVVYDK